MEKKAAGIFILVFLVLLVPVIALNFRNVADSDVLKEASEKGSARVLVYTDDNELKKNAINTFTGGFSAELNANEIAELSGNYHVKKIEKEGIRRVFLQSSVGLVNASASHKLQQGGINLTGLGQTVCVIDTGANFTHPDLGRCWGSNNISSSCKVVGGYDFCADGIDCSTSDLIPEDVYGHGTHVAGIVAANGSINGVAPDAKLAILKACNSTGDCYDSAIISAIQWCVGNASALNISVISMSLGGGSYTNYCNTDTLASYINNAVGNNISVVVATGNSNYNNRISSPACVQNATAVSSVTKADAISSFSNRYSLMSLFAPGTSINSTKFDETYELMSGTSMATPHVSGAIVIMRQYLALSGQNTRTPRQLELILNKTGKLITDSTNGNNYSRIQLYEAIVNMDIDYPNVNLISPSNNTNSVNANQTFVCNATDLALANATFYLWNSSYDIINQTFVSIGGASAYSFQINVTGISVGEYKWNCMFHDNNNNSVLASANYSLTISNVSVLLNSPINGLRTRNNQTFVCNASSSQQMLRNITFYLWNSSSGIVNQTVFNITGLSNSSTLTHLFSSDGTYFWNCFAETINGTRVFASTNRTIVYDTTKPIINLTNPVNGSYVNRGLFNISLNEAGYCMYAISNVNISMDAGSGANLSFSSENTTLNDGSYNITFSCNDSVGNWGAALVSSFILDRTTPNVTLVGPGNGYIATGTTTISFEYNVSDNLNLTSCSLIWSSAIQASNASVILKNQSNSISKSVGEGSYTWSINCTDQAGNTGNSSSRTLTINSASSSSSSSSSSGGGGSSSTTKTYKITDEQMANGYAKTLKEGDKLEFEIKDKEHSLKISRILSKRVDIIIESYKIELTLVEGQTAKVNLTSSDKYDLSVKLNKIKDGETEVEVKSIDEIVKKDGLVISGNVSNIDINITTNTSIGKNYTSDSSEFNDVEGYAIFSVRLMLLLLVIVVGLIVFEKKKKNWFGKKNN